MAGPCLPVLRRSAWWLAAAFAAAMLVLLIVLAGDEATIAAIPLAAWVAAPIAVAAGFVEASSTRLGASAFMTLEIAMIASVVWVVVDFLYLHPSAFGGVSLILLPFVHATGLLIMFLGAMLFGWRMRPDFLRN